MARDLFLRLSEGQRDAFDEVCRRYGERVARIARGLLGRPLRSRVETADVVQTVLAALLGSRGSLLFDSEAAFLRWIQVVTERKILRLARHWHAEKRPVGMEIALEDLSRLPDGQSEAPPQVLDRKETAERLILALARLPPGDRELAISRLFLKLPWSTVSRSFGISEEAAVMRYARVRRRLRRLLSEAPGEQ